MLFFKVDLNAFRMEAKEGFLLNEDGTVPVEVDVEVVATEDWEACAKGRRGAWSRNESSEARESPRVCALKKLRSAATAVVGVMMVGDSCPDALPNPNAPERPNGTGVVWKSSSSKSAREIVWVSSSKVGQFKDYLESLSASLQSPSKRWRRNQSGRDH